MEWWGWLIYLVSIAIGLWILYGIIRGAVGAAIRNNAWAIRGEERPPSYVEREAAAAREQAGRERPRERGY